MKVIVLKKNEWTYNVAKKKINKDLYDEDLISIDDIKPYLEVSEEKTNYNTMRWRLHILRKKD